MILLQLMEKNRSHDGYPFYTIGQRKLGVSLGSNPTYVIGIDPEKILSLLEQKKI